MIIFSLLSVGICFKWGAWRRWREFYPTILYLIIGSLAYDFIFHDHSLWEYKVLVNHTLSAFLMILLVYPSVVILYLTHYPESRGKQVLYIVLWSAAATAAEGVSMLTGGFTHHNGWCLYWSFALDLIGFLLLRLHYKHPLAVWPISAALCLITMLMFDLPFLELK